MASSELVAFDPETRASVDRLALPAGPLNIAAHPRLPVLYASLPRQNRVVEISLSGRGISRQFATGIEPDGLVMIERDQVDAVGASEKPAAATAIRVEGDAGCD
jgi:hypothetical protein